MRSRAGFSGAAIKATTRNLAGRRYSQIPSVILVSSDAIVRVHPATGAQTEVSAGGELNGIQGIAVGFDDEIAAAIDADAIVGVDPIDGAQRVIAASNLLLSPTDVALVPEPRSAWMQLAAIATLLWLAGRRRRPSGSA